MVPPRPLASVAALIEAGLANPDDQATLQAVEAEFKVLVSPEMLGAIGRTDDPVARQFLPDARELVTRPEELHDPIGDRSHSPVFGLTHRYPDRAILHLTQTCAVYCRFCFRRETVGDSGHLTDPQLEAIYAHLRATPAIREVILTGGDPLVLSPRRLAGVIAALGGLGTLDSLRIHTRVPVVAPERISPDMVAALRGPVPVWVVVHTNHAQELTEGARAALARLADAGVPLLAQSVLLRGVNDTVEALETLFRTLLRNRVKPYYLHHCDLARGTSQFRTTIAEGQALMAALRGRLSGAALPTYVLDIPGGHGKVPIGPDYLHSTAQGHIVTDPRGGQHAYADPAR
jgi:lysine 2,3-aminomutase